jgi:alpha-1,3/alpha-1,6-mannosyltransferase
MANSYFANGGDDDETLAEIRRNKTFRIAFIHPDLGIGGAERLVVDAAVGLQELGHESEIITSHHDERHCFEPTRDGTIKVHHAKTLFPRNIAGGLHLPLAIARQLSLVFQLLVALFAFHFPGSIPGFLYRHLTNIPPLQEYDVFIVDQLSTCVPLLRIFTATRVLFYCHFPDKDVGSSIARQKAIERGQSGPGVLRAMYRVPFDLLEEMTMSTSDKILVNSEFTSSVFQKTFFRLARIPRVVYPGIDLTESTAETVEKALSKLKAAEGTEGASADEQATRKSIHEAISINDRPTLVSINRFEAKKNIALAIDTFVLVQKELATHGETNARLRLVLAGGYDPRLQDNVLTLKELQAQCDKHGLSHLTLFYNSRSKPMATKSTIDASNASVIFLPSLPYPLLQSLLLHATSKALLYTPTEEHFGIVPLEAMAAGLPVLATNSGGPMESVVDLAVMGEAAQGGVGIGTGLKFENAQGTGLLRRGAPKLWSLATLQLLRLSEAQRTQLAHNARTRVQDKFSRPSMARAFERCLWELQDLGHVRAEEGLLQWSIAIGLFILMSIAFIMLVRYVNVKHDEQLRTLRQIQDKLRTTQSEIDTLEKIRNAAAI